MNTEYISLISERGSTCVFFRHTSSSYKNKKKYNFHQQLQGRTIKRTVKLNII